MQGEEEEGKGEMQDGSPWPPVSVGWRILQSVTL